MIERWEVEPLRRPRRGLDERLVVAAPWLLRPVAWQSARARPGSRFRRTFLGHLLRVGIAQVNRHDYEAVSSVLSPDVELHMYSDSAETRPAGMEPVYRGREGYLKALADWEAAFQENRWEVRELVDAGGDRMGARVEIVSRGAGSGIETRMTQFIVWKLERGQLRRQWVLPSEPAMLAVLTRRGGVRSSEA